MSTSKGRGSLAALLLAVSGIGAATPEPEPTGVKIFIVEPGVYRVNYDDLVALGSELGDLHSAQLDLSNAGEPVPIWIEDGRDGRFGAGDWFEFVGDRLPGEVGFLNEYSPVNVYLLRWDGDGGPTMETASRAPEESARGCRPSYSVSRHEEEDRLLLRFSGRNRNEEVWYWAKLSNLDKKPFRYSFYLTNLDTRALRPMMLRIRLRGWSHPSRKVDATLPDHRVEISFNGEVVGSVEWDGQEEATAEIEIPVGVCRPAENHIELTVPGRVPAEGEDALIDVAVLNWIEMTYPRHAGVGHQQTRIGLDESCYPAPDRLFTNNDRNFAVYGGGTRYGRDAMVRRKLPNGRFFHLFYPPGAVADGQDFFWVVPEGREKLPVAMELHRESNLKDEGIHADYIMIVHSRLIEAIEPLAEFHRERGLVVRVVDVNDVYDEFNHGILHPRAIRDFLSHAFHSWAPPAPRFVLLVGDASWDARNEDVDEKNYVAWTYSSSRALAFPVTQGTPYANQDGVNNRNLVPTWSFLTLEGHAASDNYFVSFGDETGQPDMAIGRFPVVEPDEVTAIVEKTVRYTREAVPGPWRRRILWISDGHTRQDRISDALASVFASAGYAGEKIKPALSDPDNLLHRKRLIEGFDRGQFLVHFIGHGGRFIWRTAPADLEKNRDLFTLDDVDRLRPQPRPPIVLSMTCYTAPFDHPTSDSIGEKFLRTADKGAVAVVAASWRTASTSESSQDLIEELSTSTTLGEALMRAKRKSGHRDFIHIFNLLGDPALPVEAPSLDLEVRTDTSEAASVVVSLAADRFNGQALVEWVDGDGTVLYARELTLESPSFAVDYEGPAERLDDSEWIRVYAWSEETRTEAAGAIEVHNEPVPIEAESR